MLAILLLLFCFVVVGAVYSIRVQVRRHSVEMDLYLANIKKHNRKEREEIELIREHTLILLDSLAKKDFGD